MKSFKRIFSLHSGYFLKRFIATLVIYFCLLGLVFGQAKLNKAQKTLTILHTNDIHDHIRSDMNGVGGLPFVSGFIHNVCSNQGDILVLDAGDVAEKGDLVAAKNKSKITFQAMKKIGYDAWSPGNHDIDLGLGIMRSNSELANFDRLSINLYKKNGDLFFRRSKIYKINGIKVGIIGASLPSDKGVKNFGLTVQAIVKESKRLKSKADLIILLAHIPPADCKKISKAVPDIDIFVAGHSHETLTQPIIVPNTNALILEAGCFAQYVGQLKITMNSTSDKIQSYNYKLVKMDHAKISPDVNMMEWIRKKELSLAPRSQQIIGWSHQKLSKTQVGMLAAEALRKSTGADIAFNSGKKVLRQGLPAGKLDVNVIHRAVGKERQQLISVNLPGKIIDSYIQGLRVSKWYLTQWSGFSGKIKNGLFLSDLDPAKNYQVVMTQREWVKRFKQLFSETRKNPSEWPGIASFPEGSFKPELLEMTWDEAMISSLSDWNENHIGLEEGLNKIKMQTGLPIKVTGN